MGGPNGGGSGGVEIQQQGYFADAILFKHEEQTGLCLLVTLAYSQEAQLGIPADNGWVVRRAQLSDAAADCVRPAGGSLPIPGGQIVDAVCGNGTLDATTGSASELCNLSISATFQFPAKYGWVPASDTCDGSNIGLDMLPCG
jgi:hypothetical protein